ncbi:uncharacterized protein LOC130794560 isoform X2 [Actinidia eriantha]|uniref:uncharacterized protein LOC130794560 isoform X2 n=1 Tax=Actinidia eriantha TaxID=165200 RepID=UPI00258DBCE8|nr:uncharacterized protein LOC130794560 isoform X2 [Actinidia eriantha]
MFSQSIFKNQIFRSNRRLWNTTTRPKNVGNPPPPPRLTFTTLFLRSHLRLPPLSLQIRHRSLLSHPPLPSLFRPRSPPLSPPMSSADSNTTNTKTMLMRILVSTKRSNTCTADYDHVDDASSPAEDLPEDVKEGHFVVHTFDHGELKRFIIKLGYLADPSFLKLLKKAEEEFGVRCEGVLAVPCKPNELHLKTGERADGAEPRKI